MPANSSVQKPRRWSKLASISDAIKTAQKLPDSTYLSLDISDEKVREIHLAGGVVYKIQNPKTLIIRRGGMTHRVVDEDGIVHCYAAPETGRSVIRWIPRDKNRPIRF